MVSISSFSERLKGLSQSAPSHTRAPNDPPKGEKHLLGDRYVHCIPLLSRVYCLYIGTRLGYQHLLLTWHFEYTFYEHDYYGLLWITMDYYGLLWITMDYCICNMMCICIIYTFSMAVWKKSRKKSPIPWVFYPLIAGWWSPPYFSWHPCVWW